MTQEDKEASSAAMWSGVIAGFFAGYFVGMAVCLAIIKMSGL